MPWISKKRIEALEAEIRNLRHSVERLDNIVKYSNDEFDVGVTALEAMSVSRRPNTTTVKTLLFDIMDFLKLKPVYRRGTAPGYHLVPEQGDE